LWKQWSSGDYGRSSLKVEDYSMTQPLSNQDLSDKPGERVIDKAELPAAGITNENDVLTETVSGQLQLSAARQASSRYGATSPRASAERMPIHPR
jgi:hypothetical protein